MTSKFACNLYLIQTNLSCAFIAQLVEHGTENPCVVGSIPTEGTTGMILIVKALSKKPQSTNIVSIKFKK